jgi:hypothetical protein
MHLNRESGKEEPQKRANELLISTKKKRRNKKMQFSENAENKERQQIKSYVLKEIEKVFKKKITVGFEQNFTHIELQSEFESH